MLGLEQASKNKGPMFIMVWRCTHGCNLNCMYCSFRGGDLPKVPAPDELDVKGALNVVNEIHDFGATWFGLSGGEPLTRGDIFEPINHLFNGLFQGALDLILFLFVIVLVLGLFTAPVWLKKIFGWAKS